MRFEFSPVTTAGRDLYRMVVLIQLLSLGGVFVLQTKCVLMETRTPNEEFYGRLPNISLDHVIESLNVTNVTQCCLKCNLNSNCRLEMIIKEATFLKDADLIGKQDPYIKF